MGAAVERRGPGRPRDEAIDAAILDATVEEMIDRGYLGMSMEAVAVRAGVAKTTLYRRWPSIEELCVAAIRSVSAAEPEDDPLPPGGSPLEELELVLERMRRKWADPRYGALMRRVAADATQQPEIYVQVRERVVAPHIAAMDQALQQAVAAGLMRDDVDLDWVRQLLVSPILASTMTLRGQVPRAQLAFTIDTVLNGLAP